MTVGVDDDTHGIELVDESKTGGNNVYWVDDGGKIHPKGENEAKQVLDVSIKKIGGGDKKRKTEGENLLDDKNWDDPENVEINGDAVEKHKDY